MKYNNKTFQQKYEAWKNGADYWKDIRGINLGGDSQVEESTPEEQAQLNSKVGAILAAYDSGKDDDIAKEITEPMPYDTPLSEEHPILHKYQRGKDYAQDFYNEMVAGGVDPVVAAGIAGNIQQESSFMHDATSSTGKYKGYAQLSPELRDYVTQAYGGYGHAQQMQFLIDMAKGNPRYSTNKYYKEMRSRAKSFADQSYISPEAAANGWEVYFEKSGGQNMKNRTKYARNIYDRYYKPDSRKTAVDVANEDMNASPIISNSPSLQQPATIRADVPNTLLGPSQEEIKARISQQINAQRQQMLDKLTTSPLPNILTLLPQNNFGKDAYGQKFWQRRGRNLHFKGGKDKQSFDDWAQKASKYKGIQIDGDPTYDYKGWYNEDPNRAYSLLNDDPSAHFDDRWKTPYHPTFSDQSMYSNAKHPGGTWGRYDYRDAYYAPMFSYTNPGDRIAYLNMAEDNGVVPLMNNGAMYRLDGDLYGGVLPAVKVVVKKKGGKK